jgi:tetratricopeptide (TPR) repeat protein
VEDRNTTSEKSEGKPRSRRVSIRLGAVLVGLLPFVLAEVGLRGFDAGRSADSSDPLSGFNPRSQLFERQGNVYRTARARERFFTPQEFPVTKPANEFRFFCFGGSTVFGHPYQADTAFPKWLELELSTRDPTHAYRAVNCGGISYASYRETALVKEVLQYQPDLILFATGHNEFLEDRTYHSIKKRPAAWAWLQNTAYSLRIVNLARRWFVDQPAQANDETTADQESQLSPEVRARLDSASGYASYHRDDAWRENVIAQFDESVRAIVASCRAAGVPIMLVKPGSNLRDCPPFKSEHRADLAPEEEHEWQKAFDAATVADETNPEQALEHYRKAETIDGDYALLSYRIARVLDRLGRIPDALTYYCKARDEDICPLRIIKPMEQSLARIAVETGTPFLDAARLLSAESFDYIPGFECYLDHVHPTIGGHQKIARALAAQMREGGLLPKAVAWPEEKRRATYTHHLEQLGPRYFAEGKERVNWLEHWARRERLLEETLPHDARGYVRLGFRRLDLGDESAAWRSFDEALKRNPTATQLLQKHAQDLVSQGRSQSATNLLRRISSPTETQPRHPAVVN